MRRALISVSDKSKVVGFAQGLVEAGFEVISTGGTLRALREGGVEARQVSEVTGFDEILDGRVKTLHPKIHGGILARDTEAHRAELATAEIEPIDLVCVNLYPFRETLAKGGSFAEAIEQIDIGGPTMVRAAAKSHERVTVVVSPEDYDGVLEELGGGGVSDETRRRLAAKAFRHTAAYDALIAEYLTEATGDEEFTESLTVSYDLVDVLRYGENPHQQAAFYAEPRAAQGWLTDAEQLHGKALSFNNINDASAALAILREFEGPAAVAVKHVNPCGVGVGESIAEAFQRAREADPISIFGGIIALNREVDTATAEALHEIFLEIVMAPSFSDDAMEILTQKKNLRLLAVADGDQPRGRKVQSVPGGLLVQGWDRGVVPAAEWEVVTQREPTATQRRAMELAWRVVKHVKSNAIVVAEESMTLGVGAGQMNRVGAARIAAAQAGAKARGAVMASDAFFPMRDTVDLAAAAGIGAIIQPGGSIRDQESIDAADEANIAMVFTGMRHFRH